MKRNNAFIISFSLVNSKKIQDHKKEKKIFQQTPKVKHKKAAYQSEMWPSYSVAWAWFTGIQTMSVGSWNFPKEIFTSFIFRSFECLWISSRAKCVKNASWEPAAQAHPHHPHNIGHLDLIRRENKGDVAPRPARGKFLGTSCSFSLFNFAISFILVKTILV